MNSINGIKNTITFLHLAWLWKCPLMQQFQRIGAELLVIVRDLVALVLLDSELNTCMSRTYNIDLKMNKYKFDATILNFTLI